MRLFILILAIGMISFSSVAKLPESKTQIQLSFAPVVKKVSPAVVNIYAKKIVQRRVQHPFFSDPFFNQFFGNSALQNRGFTRKRMENTLGSGFIVGDDGLVVTNAHVIKGGQEILTQLSDRREFAA